MNAPQFQVHEAKTHLSKLLERVRKGEEIVIARAGVPIARLVPFREPLKKRKPGLGRDVISLAPDFHVPLPEAISREFEQ